MDDRGIRYALPDSSLAGEEPDDGVMADINSARRSRGFIAADDADGVAAGQVEECTAAPSVPGLFPGVGDVSLNGADMGDSLGLRESHLIETNRHKRIARPIAGWGNRGDKIHRASVENKQSEVRRIVGL